MNDGFLPQNSTIGQSLILSESFDEGFQPFPLSFIARNERFDLYFGYWLGTFSHQSHDAFLYGKITQQQLDGLKRQTENLRELFQSSPTPLYKVTVSFDQKTITVNEWSKDDTIPVPSGFTLVDLVDDD